MTATSGMADAKAPGAALAVPRFEDGSANMREPPGQLAESAVSGMMPAEAGRPCEATGNGGDGYRGRSPVTCVGTLTLRIPKLPRAASSPTT